MREVLILPDTNAAARAHASHAPCSHPQVLILPDSDLAQSDTAGDNWALIPPQASSSPRR